MNMTTTFRRIAAGAALLAAPALIALGTAAASYADPGVNNNGTIYTTPAPHPAFPIQTNAPQPGTQVHHSHQNNR
jgi:hypothetical protein